MKRRYWKFYFAIIIPLNPTINYKFTFDLLNLISYYYCSFYWFPSIIIIIINDDEESSMDFPLVFF